MKYDDLEKTQDLFDIPEDDVPNVIDDIDREGISKENLTDDLTFGLSGDDAVEPQREDEAEIESLEEEKTEKNKFKKKKEKKEKRKFKEVWASWSKRKKVLVILIPILVLVLIAVALILFFVLRDNEEPEPTPEEPEVIVEMDNYIYQDGTLIFLNSNGDEIGTYECINKSEELCFVPNYSEEDFDGEKNVYENEALVERPSKIYQDEYVFVFDNESVEDEEIILYNIEEQEEVDTYSLLKGYSNSDVVILRDTNNRFGVLEFSQDGVNEILGFSYDFIGRLNSEARFVVQTNDRYYIYNLEGENVSNGLRYEIRSYNDSHIVVDNNGYYVYDYNGNLIFDDAYDYIELLDAYAVLIDRGSLYIRDYQNNKYNEEGIDLSSTYYNPLNIYSEDRIYTGTRRAYEVVINDGVMDVTYTRDNRERTTSIDLQDGVMSAKYNYISYFDGVLYFYQDEEKTDILGTYECSNANGTDLKNCTIATDSFYSDNALEENKSDSVGWIPIYNDRFVFILDTIDLNNPTIILYDLETDKDLARYSSVDSGAYTGKKEITFVDTDATYIMAQVKSDGDYGLIRISDNVAGTIGFDYDSIEKFGEYYQVGSSTGTYKLYRNVGGDAVTAEYGYPIVNYLGNYVVVEDNGAYYVYDFDGNKQGRGDDAAYHYVDLQNNYFVVIDSSNKLDIRKYSDPEFALSETIDVGTSNYEGAYTISEVSGGFSVTVTSTNTIYVFDSAGVLQ